MTLIAALLAPLLAVAAVAAPATSAPAAPAEPTATTDPLREAERLGLELYRADRVAWLTTDQLTAHGIVRDGRFVTPGEPQGWVTAPSEDPAIWSIAYLAEVDGALVSVADGTVDFNAEPLASLRRNQTPRPLDAAEIAQHAVRDDAVGREWMSCSRAPYNTATVPDGHGGWNVYLMPPQVRDGLYPMGGFHRFSYDAQGRFVSAYAHTRSCIDQDMNDAPGNAIRALMITHITTPVPNEIHVFMSLSYAMAIYVATQDGTVWKVEDGRIERSDIGGAR